MNHENHLDYWYLMYCSFPDINWARLRIFDNGMAEILDCDGLKTQFKSKADAINFLHEDEYIAYGNIDRDDEKYFGINIAEIIPPKYFTDLDLLEKMYIKCKR